MLEVIKEGVELLKIGAETLWYVFYTFWLNPETPAGLRAALWIPIIAEIFAVIIHAIKRSRK